MSPRGALRLAVVVVVFVLGPRASAVPAPAGDAAAPAPAPALQPFLLHTAPPETGEGADYGLLLREVARQALLIAARDQLALPTRDEALGEVDEGAAGAFDVTTFANPKKLYRVRLSQGGKAVWEKELPIEQRGGAAVDIEQLVTQFELMSRKEMVDGLKQAGLKARPRARRAAPKKGAEDAAPPPLPDAAETEALLWQMNVLPQFDAVRRAHTRIRAEGETPEALSVLVRGYANLGQLLRFLWSPQHKAFEARSLLYGQRMAARYPDDPRSLYSRGYARAMVGLHAGALKDMEAADKLVEEGGKPKPQPKPAAPAPRRRGRAPAAAEEEAPAPAPAAVAEQVTPPWAHLIRSLCHYETQKLSEAAVAGGEAGPLASYLTFLTVETSGCQGAEVGAAQAALRQNPNCLRLIDAMAHRTGPGPLNELTVQGPAVLRQSLVEWLPKMSLPGPAQEYVTRTLEQFEQNPPGQAPQQQPQLAADKAAAPKHPRAALVEALVSAGAPATDEGEPSSAALARIVQECTFVHVQRRADLIALKWGQDASRYAAAALPTLAGHRYAPLIEAYGQYRRGGAQVWGKALATIKPKDPELSALPMFTLMRGAVQAPDGPGSPWHLCTNSTDDVAWDMERVCTVLSRPRGNPNLPDHLARLKEISPHSPVVASIMIRSDWAAAEKLIPQWEKQFGDHPALIDSLAWKYLVLKKYDQAERWAKRYVAINPDAAAYYLLAESYRMSGNDDKWIETLEQYLSTAPHENLSHARVLVSIAEHLLVKGQAEKALGYAEPAARSGAAWAMNAAMVANERAERFDKAQKWAIANAVHYDQAGRWLGWCLRTGQGDEKEAWSAAREQAGRVNLARASREDLLEVANLHLYEGQPQKALPILKRAYQPAGDPWAGLQAAVIANDVATRDEALDAVITRGPTPSADREPRPQLIKLAAWLKANWDKGADPALDLSAVDKLAKECVGKPHDAANVYFFTSRFLSRHKRNDEALNYLKRCAAVLAIESPGTNQNLAWMELRKAGIDPAKLPVEPPPGHDELAPQIARE
jgi:tetratricopeptide (TPR) repeat protein